MLTLFFQHSRVYSTVLPLHPVLYTVVIVS